MHILLNKKSKLALIDIDDTAVRIPETARLISEEGLRYEVNKVLEARGGQPLTSQEFSALAKRMRDFGSLTQAWQFQLDMPNEWSFKAKRHLAREYIDAVNAANPADPEVVKAIQVLLEEHDYRIVVATQSPDFLARPLMENAGWSHLIDEDHMVDIQKLNNMTKNTLLFMLYIKEHFGLDYSELHILDDMLRNIRNARRQKFTGWLIGNHSEYLASDDYDVHSPHFLPALQSLPIARQLLESRKSAPIHLG